MIQKQMFFDRFPPSVPAHYRLWSWGRRACRQMMSRCGERQALKQGCPGLVPDGPWDCAPAGPARLSDDMINRPALWIAEDLGVPHVRAAVESLMATKEKMSRAGLQFCSAAGTFVKSTYTSYNEQKKLWEDAWVLAHADVRPGLRVLDVGGASTPFSFSLADEGCAVTVVDNDWGNCGTVYNVNHAAKAMNWRLTGMDRDISSGLPFPDASFDRVFSICVVEHLTSLTRRLMMKEVSRVLRPGGIVGVTIDHDPGRKSAVTDKGLRFGYRQKLEEDILRSSGLSLMGNKELVDTDPGKPFLGAFFLKKA